MARSQVDFTLVRYSDIEGTHYFYDPAHPTAIQFLLNGNWESWDVGYVKYRARDPDVKRVAEEAESYLVGNPILGYRQWPYEPPLASPAPAAHVQHMPPQPIVDPSLPSPSADKYPSPTSQAQPYPHPYSSHQTPLVSPQYENAPRLSPPPGPYYHETYKPQPTSDASALPSIQLASTNAASYPPVTKSSYGTDNPVPHVGSPSASLPQTGTASPVLLSRNRETKILLSLDGDGVRGLSQVLLVESLVNAVCTKVGAQVEPYQIFDLVGGCSMGGVFGLMLSRLRMRAQKAREAYKIIAKEVFQNKRDFFTSIDPHAPPVTHDGTSLKNAINGIVTQELGNSDELLYDTRDDSTDVFVIATRIDIGTNKAALMRSFQTRRITGPEVDANITVSDAMTASCISPRYLKTQESAAWRPVIEPGVVDHGTAKNNPIRDILYECRKLYRYTNDMMVIISIGSGKGFDPHRELPEMAKSVHERQVEGGGWGEKFEADHYAHMERGWMKYFRFNVPDLHDVPLEEWCHEERMKDKTLAYLSRPDVGAMFYACVDAITAVLVNGQHR
ncbi:FabD/lysophospholipase-like protein [Periconia macrospinosa]|uniref:FabD/lysophospholipase-like protein n=1 Tax=Periconia macrospinosa TaxID=97972 RepID=A0A2V1EAK6_9PLEO|nr:FabD/lysophospholipase-like protein [Periconia macrospinosa]